MDLFNLLHNKIWKATYNQKNNRIIVSFFNLYNYKNKMVFVYLFVIKSCKRY